MNEIRSVNPRRVIVILVLVLLVSLVFFFWMRDVVREVIVLPLSYLMFLAGILIESTPQLFFWLAILIIAFWIAYRSLSTRRRAAPSIGAAFKSELHERYPFSGRVSFWTVKVNQMRRYHSSYYQSTFHQTLSRLLLELLAHRYRLTLNQAEERLRSGLLEVPPEVREYALASLGRFEPTRLNFFARLWKMISSRIRNWYTERYGQSSFIQDDRLAAQAEAQVSRIIQYMEEELEISHDHPSQ